MASKKGINYLSKLLLSIIVFCDLFILAAARPDPAIESENDAEEAYYGSDGGPDSDSLREDEEAPLNNEEPKPAQNDDSASLEQQEQDTKEHVYLHRSAKEIDSQSAAEKFADADRANNEGFDSDGSMIVEDKFQSTSKRRAKTDNNGEPNDLTYNNPGGRELYRVGHRKNMDTVSKNLEDSGNMYANEREPQYNKRFDESEGLNEPMVDHSRRSRTRKNSKFLQNRDRRQVQETIQKDANVSTLNAGTEAISENDEIAIKKQIKELSNQELDELLNSLSEDKRNLLKKILEDNSEEPQVKREITKKAGAVEENNCMEGGQIDLSETGGVGLSITASNTDISNSTENAQKVSTVSPKSDSKLQLNSNDLIDSKVQGSSEQVLNADVSLNTAVDNKAPTKENEESKEKSDYKRETNSNEFDSAYASEDVCPDDMSEILNEETELESNRNSYKREAPQDDTELAEAMKSLEESFPNSKNYDESSADLSNLAPLVRVKRKNDGVKKRSVNISPTAYNSENEDEDNEEASEFDDEGFNEHQSNMEKNFASKQNEEISFVEDTKELSQNGQLASLQQSCNSDNSNKENDAIAIGSDSDNVISGVEGVDENLMYSGVSRNKRNMDRFYKPEVDLNRLLQTTSIVDNNLQATAENMQVGSYQENDAFGPLPRNFEGDLGRYKRVRQVKQ